MIKILFLFACCWFARPSQAQIGSIQFVNEPNWERILSQAQAENKLIFVYLSATWCSTCRRMQQIFKKPAVAQDYNQHFIAWQADGEKDYLGKQWMERYALKGYPSFLFFSPKGELLHWGLGFMDEKAFLDLSQAARQPLTQIATQQKRFENGERSPEFLFHYAYLCNQTNHPHSDTSIRAYLQAQPNWLDPKAQQLIVDLVDDVQHPAFQFFVQNQKKFIEQLGKEKVDERLLSVALLDLNASMMEKEDQFSIAQDIEPIFKKYFRPEQAERLSSYQQLQFYANSGEWEAFFDLAERYERRYLWFRRKGGDYVPRSKEYLALASMVSENSDRPKHLKQARRWGKRSVKLNPSYHNCYTLASYYYNLGNKKQAHKYLRKALKRSRKVSKQDKAFLLELEEQIKSLPKS
jgi:thioredoxin-related protein